jgi:hypothetical protein
MTDSIRIGPDAHSNSLLAQLREGQSEGEIGNEVDFLPGVILRADPALGISGRYSSPAGRLLDLEVSCAEAGDWFALHVNLPAHDLGECGVIGFACRGSAATVEVIRPCLRSGTANGFVDCFFDKHVLMQPEERTHLDALAVHHREALPVTAPWRELVLFLPTKGFRLSLGDLRVFAV